MPRRPTVTDRCPHIVEATVNSIGSFLSNDVSNLHFSATSSGTRTLISGPGSVVFQPLVVKADKKQRPLFFTHQSRDQDASFRPIPLTSGKTLTRVGSFPTIGCKSRQETEAFIKNIVGLVPQFVTQIAPLKRRHYKLNFVQSTKNILLLRLTSRFLNSCPCQFAL